tara:strand:- start:428 stop:1612 length:1185 start_codon:yes stop_codon:yes gene_type:complete
MIKDNFYEKISLILILTILNNYLLLSFNIPQLLIKINFLFFILVISFFYFKNFLENPYLKIFFLFIIFISLGTPTFEWDARSIWLFHAKRIFYDQSIFSITDNYARFSHNAYPTLVPALASSLATLIGHWNEVFPKLSFTLVFLPPLILTYIFFKNTKYLIFLFIVFFTIGKFLFNGWADGLVAIYFGLSALLMYLLCITENRTYKENLIYYFLAICFFITLTLIKNEGIALLLILFTVTFLMKLFGNKNKKDIYNIFFLSCSFLPIILWKVFCYYNQIIDVYSDNDIFLNFFTRFQYIENYKLIAYFLLLNEKFLICLFFFLFSFWLNLDKNLLIFVFLNLTFYIIVLFFIFLSTHVDFYFQLDSAASRVIRSLNFFLAFFGLYNLRYYKKLY